MTTREDTVCEALSGTKGGREMICTLILKFNKIFYYIPFSSKIRCHSLICFTAWESTTSVSVFNSSCVISLGLLDNIPLWYCQAHTCICWLHTSHLFSVQYICILGWQSVYSFENEVMLDFLKVDHSIQK